jgi:hypothetical protein
VKLFRLPILLILLALLSSCDRQEGSAERSIASAEPQRAQLAKEQAAPGQQVSLDQASNSQAMAEAMNRKIIRNGELTLEVADPLDAQRKISSIAETLGGFVVTSEAKQRRAADGASEQLEVNLVIRVPAPQFGPAMEQIRSAGGRVIADKETGQDVTEEFIDLEAHIKTQKALEDQFLEIMKRANKVEEALEVQRQIAEVRTEIEKLEGRKRFLENHASLSTITVSLQNPTAIAVNTTGFGRDIRQAVADSVQVAIAIVLFLIRFVIVIIPIFVLLVLPTWLVGRYFWRRARRAESKKAAAAASATESESD